jgi:riboflavin synthase
MMFTGLIETIGTITQIKPAKKGDLFLKITPSISSFLNDVKVGDSINVEGACQTVTHLSKESFEIYSSITTLELTNFKNFKIGKPVNLEKALKVGERLHGHFVYGHVEGIGCVESVIAKAETTLLTIKAPLPLMTFILKQGSISINGVSLTIYDVQNDLVTVALIPETMKNTTLSFLRQRDCVNIETDPLIKGALSALQKFCFVPTHTQSNLKEALKNNGFTQE